MMNFKIKYGCSRIAILIFNYCIKFPYIYNDPYYGKFYSLAKGIQHNMVEYKLSKFYSELCPVYFSFLGLMNIMPRCKELTQNEMGEMDETKFTQFIKSGLVENKSSSFGKYKNTIVAIDFH